MPVEQQHREIPFANPEQEPFHFFGDPVSDAYALRVVVDSFSRSSAWRQSNHDQRWLKDDQLYRGEVPVRYWKGSKIPRANLGIQVSFDQVESAYPNIVGELFGQTPYWFGVEATHMSQPEQARAVQSALAFQLTSAWDRSGTNAEHQLKMSVRQLLQHGNGVCEVGWHPVQNRLMVDHVDLRDFFFDSSITSPIIDHAAFVIRRKMVKLSELEALRGVQGYNVPSRAVLAGLAKKLPLDTPSDTTKQQSASIFREDAGSLQNLLVDPTHQTMELLQYWTDDRLIWVLNRRVIVTNRANPYGFKPFVMAPLYIVLGRPYAMSIPDVIEGEQQFIQGVVNARIDELSLALHPPRAMAQDAKSRAGERWEPGLVIGVDKPEDISIEFPKNFTQTAFEEVGLAQGRIDRRTGINQFVQSGQPAPSNANRSATGIVRQIGASNTRLRPIVENIEDYFILPLLYKSHEILKRFSQGYVLGQNGQVFRKEDVAAPVRFRMVAASKMVTRDRLLQLMGPVTNLLLNQGFVQSLQQQGLTVNLQEWTRFFQDSVGLTETYSFFRQLSPQEQQQIQQATQQQIEASLAEKRLESQTRLQMGEMKSKTDLTVAQIEADTKSNQTAEQSSLGILKLIAQQMNERTKMNSQEKQAVLKSVFESLKAKDQNAKSRSSNNS